MQKANLSLNKSQRLMVRASISILALILYLSTLDFAVSGDAIIYGVLAEEANTTFLTLHIAYYFIAHYLHQVFLLVGSIGMFEFLVYVNAICAAFFIYYYYEFVRQLTEDEVIAFLSSVVLALSGKFLLSATQAEVYMPQTLCLLLSILLALKARPVASGVAYALALLMSPLSLFAAPALVYIAHVKRLSSGSIVRFLLAAGIIYVPVFLYIFDELLFGVRGLLTEDEQMRTTIAGLTLAPKYIVKYYFLLTPFIIVGAIAAFRNYRFLFFTMVWVAVPSIYLAYKLPSEGHVQFLIIDLFIAAIIGAGIASSYRLLSRKAISGVSRHSAAALFTIVFLFSSYYVLPSTDTQPGNYASDMKTFYKDIIGRQNDAVVLTSWKHKIAFEYYNFGVIEYFKDAPMPVNTYDLRTLSDEQLLGVTKDRMVFVLEGWSPSRLTRLLSPQDTLKSQKERNSYVRHVEKITGVTCREQASLSFTVCQIDR